MHKFHESIFFIVSLFSHSLSSHIQVQPDFYHKSCTKDKKEIHRPQTLPSQARNAAMLIEKQ
jgi:hypothetical protein